MPGLPRSRRPPPAPGARRFRAAAIAAPSPARSPSAARSRSSGFRQEPSGRCAIAGTPPTKRCSRHGSPNCSTRRPSRIWTGRSGTKCCATSPATSSSTISAATRTRPRPAQSPDCADFVYFLRAYFAFKMGLPFGYSNCSRGTGGSPPKCYQWFDVEHPEVTRPPPPPDPVGAAANAAPPPPAEQPKILGIFNRSAPPPADTPAEPTAKPAPPQAEAADELCRICARRRRRRPYRCGARRRRQCRFLHRAADREVVASRHGVCRSLRPRADAGEACARSQRHAGRLPRRRFRAGWIGDAQAFLARQLPVRARTLARRRRLQAFPPDREAKRTAR